MDSSIVGLLRSPTLDSSSNLKITNYVEEIASEPTSVQLCFDVLNGYKNPEDPFAQFIAIKILEKQLGNFPNIKIFCACQMMEVIYRTSRQEIRTTGFVLKSMYHLITNLFLELYPENLPDFFDHLHMIMDSGTTGIINYLEIMNSISEEIRGNYVYKRFDISRINIIKTEMRQKYLVKFIETLITVAQHYGNINENVTILALKVFSEYIEWTELSITFTPRILEILTKLSTLSVSLRKSVFLCYTAFVDKGMDSNCKHQIIKDVFKMIMENEFLSQNLYSDSAIAKLIERAGIHEIDILTKCFDECPEMILDIVPVLNKLIEMSIIVYEQDVQEHYSLVLPLLNKYIYLNKSKIFQPPEQYIEKIVSATLKKCLIYSRFSSDTDCDAQDIKRNLRALMLNISQNVDIPYVNTLLTMILSWFENPQNFEIESATSLLMLILELPELISLDYIHSECSDLLQKIVLQVFEKNLHHISDSKLRCMILKVLQRYDCFYYFDGDAVKVFFEFLVGDLGLLSHFEEVSILAAQTIKKLTKRSFTYMMYNHLRVLDYLYPVVELIYKFSSESPNCKVSHCVFQILGTLHFVVDPSDQLYFGIIPRLKENLVATFTQMAEVGGHAGEALKVRDIDHCKYLLKCISRYFKGLVKSGRAHDKPLPYSDEFFPVFLNIIYQFHRCDDLVHSVFHSLKQCCRTLTHDFFQTILSVNDFYSRLFETNMIDYFDFSCHLVSKDNVHEREPLIQFIMLSLNLALQHEEYVALTPDMYHNSDELKQLHFTINRFVRAVLHNKRVFKLVCDDLPKLVKISGILASRLCMISEDSSQFFEFFSNLSSVSGIIAGTNWPDDNLFDDEFVSKNLIYPCIYAILDILRKENIDVVPKKTMPISVTISNVVAIKPVELILTMWSQFNPPIASLPLIDTLKMVHVIKKNTLVNVINTSILNTLKALHNL